MKKFVLLLFIVLSTITLVSCNSDEDQPDIVTTMFTHYDLASQIVGDKMSVSMLVPLGADIHSFEASSKDMVDINQSKLFIFTSEDIDQWLKDIDQISDSDTIVLDMSKSYVHEDHDHEHDDHEHDDDHLNSPGLMSTTLLEDDHDDHDDHDGHDDHDDHDDHDHHDDLHYWVDPTVVLQMIDYILEHIIIIDPENETYYETNANTYKSEIEALHLEIYELLAHEPYEDSTLYFAGHNAMGAFASRYHIHIESLFSEFKPDDDLTSSEIITFSNLVIEADVHYLFTEALIVPRAAIAIKESLESNEDFEFNILELHTYHNVNLEDWEAKVTYQDLLERNFENIKIALGVTD